MAASASDAGLSPDYIPTDVVVEGGSTQYLYSGTAPTPTTSIVTGNDDDFSLDPTPTEPYTGTCATPMMTGDRPYWARSGYDPYNCGSSIILLDWTIYCCNGNLIDLTQPLGSGQGSRFDHELCFENMRCCSGDPAVTHGTATSCTAGTEASMLLDSSVSVSFYADQSSSTTSEDDPFADSTSATGTATASSTPNAGAHPAPAFSLLATLLLLATLVAR